MKNIQKCLKMLKKCTKCDVAVAMGESPMEHDDCPCNYRTGSSKAMKASAALDMVVKLHDLGIGIEYIVSDDDSTMHAHLKHINTVKNAKLLFHYFKFITSSSFTLYHLQTSYTSSFYSTSTFKILFSLAFLHFECSKSHLRPWATQQLHQFFSKITTKSTNFTLHISDRLLL